MFHDSFSTTRLKPYVITKDIDGLISTGAKEVMLIRQGALADLRSMIASPLKILEWEEIKLQMEDLISGLVSREPYYKGSLVVSLDDSLYKPRQTDAVISISRCGGPEAENGGGSVITGQVARPGAPLITGQLDEIRNSRVILCDVGCYSGEQMAFVIQQLKERGNKIVAVIAGILTGQAEHRLKREIGSILGFADVLGIYRFSELSDWIEERDFYPLLGGIVVAEKNRILQAPNSIGLPCRRPYLLPFADLRERASLYRTDKELSAFSRRQIQRTINLFERLGAGTPITFSNIDTALRRPSFPYSGIPELDNFAQPKMVVTNFLEYCLSFV